MRIGAYRYEGTPEQVLSWLAKVQHGDEVAEATISRHGKLGGGFGFGGFLLLFAAFITFAVSKELYVALAIGAVGIVLVGVAIYHAIQRSDAQLEDLPDRKVAAINQFLKVIKADTPADGHVAFDIDFRPYHSGGQLVEKVGGGFFSSTKSLTYSHNWLSITGPLADGNSYRISVTEKIKRKEKAKRKYTKVKERRVGTIVLQVKLDTRRYPAPDALVRTLRRLPSPTPLRVLRVESRGRRVVAVLRAPTAAFLKGRYGVSTPGIENELTGDTLLRTMLWLYQGIGRMGEAPAHDDAGSLPLV